MNEHEIIGDFWRWPVDGGNPPYLPLNLIEGDPLNYSGSYVTLRGRARILVTAEKVDGREPEAVVTAKVDFLIQESDSEGNPSGDVTTYGERHGDGVPTYPRDARVFELELYRIPAKYFFGLKGMSHEIEDVIRWTEVPGQFKQFDTPRNSPNNGFASANGVVKRWWFDTTGGYGLVFLGRIVALIR